LCDAETRQHKGHKGHGTVSVWHRSVQHQRCTVSMYSTVRGASRRSYLWQSRRAAALMAVAADKCVYFVMGTWWGFCEARAPTSLASEHRTRNTEHATGRMGMFWSTFVLCGMDIHPHQLSTTVLYCAVRCRTGLYCQAAHRSPLTRPIISPGTAGDLTQVGNPCSLRSQREARARARAPSRETTELLAVLAVLERGIWPLPFRSLFSVTLQSPDALRCPKASQGSKVRIPRPFSKLGPGVRRRHAGSRQMARCFHLFTLTNNHAAKTLVPVLQFPLTSQNKDLEMFQYCQYLRDQTPSCLHSQGSTAFIISHCFAVATVACNSMPSICLVL
jgi:hypothetical protein